MELEFNWSSNTRVKRAEIVCKEYLPLLKHGVNMISALGGTGKTFVSLIATLHYLAENRFAKAYMWCSEDEAGEMKAREIAVVNQKMSEGIDFSHAAERICYGHTSGKFTMKSGTNIKETEYFRNARKSLSEFDFIVIDPLLNFFGGDSENDNIHARTFMMLLKQWTYEDAKTILLIHHSKKDDSGMRGASAFMDSCRIVYEFNKETSGAVSAKLTKTNYTAGMGKITLNPVPDKRFWAEDEKSDNVTITYSNHPSTGYFPVTIPFRRMSGLVRSEFMYSASTYRDDYRNAANAETGQTVFVLDIDEGMALDEAREKFGAYRAIIATTRNHQKEKHGVVCDRFRIILQCATPITLFEEEYAMMMDEAIAYFGADEKCRDISRMYYGNPDAEVFETIGDKLLDWTVFHRRAQSRRRFEESQAEMVMRSDPTPEGMMKSYQTMFDQWFVAGNRNHTLNFIRHMAEKDGVYDPNEVIESLNAQAGKSALSAAEMKLLTRRR